MGYTVEWARRATKATKRLTKNIQLEVLKVVDGLAENPRPRGAQKLKGQLEGQYRVRVGTSYRILYSINDQQGVVRIISVGSREGIYG